MAPMAAPRPKPMVPKPPEVMNCPGWSKWKCCAAHTWCWPTSVVMMELAGHVSLMMPHVNSYVRDGLGDRTPYDLFTEEFGEDVAALFGIVRFAANDFTLKPSLRGIEVKVK